LTFPTRDFDQNIDSARALRVAAYVASKFKLVQLVTNAGRGGKPNLEADFTHAGHVASFSLGALNSLQDALLHRAQA
jgi:hypothetical protein